MKIVNISGSYITGRTFLFKGRREHLSSVMALSDDSILRIEENPNKEQNLYGVYFDLKGKMHTYLSSFLLESFCEASIEAENNFLEKMHSENLKLSDDKLYILDPNAVMFIFNNKLLSRNDFENCKIPSDKSLILHWDNGYSYCGTEPISKEGFLKGVETRLNRVFTFGEYCGIWISDASMYGRCFAINAKIGSNERQSEISNS